MRSHFRPTLILAVTLLAFTVLPVLGPLTAHASTGVDVLSKIDSNLLAQATVQKKVKAIIILRDVPISTKLYYAKLGHDAYVNMLENRAKRTQDQFLAMTSRLGIKVLHRFWLLNAILVEATKRQLILLARNPLVVKIIPNFEVHVIEPVKKEPATFSIFSSSVSSWGVYKIRAPDLWSEGITGEGVRVAVLDTGVDISHPALQGKMFTINPNDPKYPGGWIEFDSNGNPVCSEPHDTQGHGTHVSGTVLGGDGQNIVIGVAPHAKLMHALVLPKGSGSFASVLAGMEWAIDPYTCTGQKTGYPAHVISMSLGASGYYGDYLLDAVRNALLSNIIIVAAIGNDGAGTSSNPGNIWGVIGVGAVDQNDNVAYFSSGETVNWENPPSNWPFFGYYPSSYIKPDVSAPGVSITSAVPGGGYESWDGTSMATPHVAGTVALILDALDATNFQSPTSQYSLPELVYKALTETAVDLGSPGQDSRYGWGRIDAYAAVHKAIELAQGGSGGGGGTPQPQPATIEGHVYDATTGQPLASAKVTIVETGDYTYTNSDGYFSFTVSPGTYTVKVERDGYRTATQQVTVSDGETKTLTFNLQPLEQKPSVAVVGNKYRGHHIPGLLSSAGYTVVEYDSIDALLADLNNGNPRNVKAVVIDHWYSDGSKPSADTVIAFLQKANELGIGVVFLGAPYAGYTGMLGLYIYNDEIEKAGFPAPDKRDYGWPYADYVTMYVSDTSSPLFSGVSYDAGSKEFYLADTSRSRYVDYEYVEFTDDSGVSTKAYIIYYSWWSYSSGTGVAVWQTPSGATWVYLSTGAESRWMQYLEPGDDGMYSANLAKVLINAVGLAAGHTTASSYYSLPSIPVAEKPAPTISIPQVA